MIGPGDRVRQAAVTAGWTVLALSLLAVLLSIARSPESNGVVQAALVAFTVLACVTPAAAVLATTALLGFGVILSHMAGLPTLRVTEALVVASLAGCAVQAIPRGSPLRRAAGEEVSAPVLLLGLAAVASAIVWQRVYQATTTYPADYFSSLARVLLRDYFVQPGEFQLIVSAAFVLQGLALYVAVAALCRADAQFFPRALRMLVLGGAGLGVLSLVRFAEILLRNPDAIAVLRGTVTGLRISPQIADYIAAGAYFSLCWLAALGLAAASPRRRAAWAAAAVPLLGALYLTGSRSVIAAALAGLAVLIAVAIRHRAAAVRGVLAVAVVAAIAMVGAFSWMTGRDVAGETAAVSLQTRAELVKTTLRVIETRPLFGIGFDRYHLLSDRLATPELDALWQGRKNPHNDFLRIGADLGLVGLGLLVWILAAAGRRIARALRQAADPRLAGLAGGLSALLVTSMVSDPLMVREVACAFWIALGLAAGHAGRTAGSGAARPAAGRGQALPILLAALIVGSIPFRAARELADVDFTHVSYGFFDWGEDEDGRVNRWTGPRATLFVDGSARVVDIPLSGAMPWGAAQEVEVRVDGRLADRVSVGLERQDLRLALPPGDPSRPRRVDFIVRPSWVPAAVLPDNDDTRELGIKIGPVVILRDAVDR